MSSFPPDLTIALADRYRVDRELGRGGMATVYLVDDLRLGRKVAFKLLHPEVAETVGVGRFSREIQLASGLTHPHILTVLDSGQLAVTGGPVLCWYTMTFVDGDSLATRLARDGRLPVGEAVGLVREIADALQYAHSRGIVHRDIKPDNILLAGGHALVADFGIARAATAEAETKLTESGFVVGTPGYMSPEQAAGERDLDGRSDLFSLGCVFYEMLMGETPFPGPTPQSRMARVYSGVIIPAATARPEAAATDPVLKRLLAADPAHRYPDAAALLADLGPQSSRSWHGISTRVTTLRRGLMLAAVTAIIAVGGFYFWRAGQRGPAVPERLAIVPFRSVGGAEVETVMGQVVANHLGLRLSILHTLEISPAGSSAAFTADSTMREPVDAALKVGAHYVLAGTVEWDGVSTHSITLKPQLLQIAVGVPPTLKWRDSIVVAAGELFHAEIAIAQSIAKRIGAAPNGATAARLARVPTANTAAYLKVLDSELGREPDNAILGAVALDPGYAEAWAMLGANCSISYRLSPTEFDANCAKQGAERSVALDSNMATARVAAGLYYRNVLRDFPRAEAELLKAAELAPGSGDAAGMLSAVQMSLGHWAAARESALRSESFDASNINLGSMRLAEIELLTGRYDEAQRHVDRALRLYPTTSIAVTFRAVILVAQGDLAGAQRWLAVAPATDTLSAIAVRATLFGEPWMFSAAQRELLFRVPPREFRGGASLRALTSAQVHWLAGRTSAAKIMADSAVALAVRDVQHDSTSDELSLRLAFALGLSGRHEDAIREGSRAAALRPVSLDARVGPSTQLRFAEVLAISGAHDSAIAVLRPLMTVPGLATPGRLTVDPWFGSLRKDPRFIRLAKGRG